MDAGPGLAKGMRRRSIHPGPEARPRPSLEVVHAGVTYRVAVKRVGTARRFTLRVRAATHDAVLTMPSRASLRTARAFAERHAEWIGVRLGGLPARIVPVPGMLLPIRGVDHLITHRAGLPGRGRVDMLPTDGGNLRPILQVTGDVGKIGQYLLGFLRREARRDLETHVRRHAGSIGKTPGRIAVRDTCSRWGSCSSKGTLSFSWRLVLAPTFVLDYLVAHEVAHLAHMDHSTKFWDLTRRLAPQTPEAELWLKANGPMLHRYALA